MPQAPYGDAESLFRAAHNELMRVRSHISYARKQLSRTVARDWEGAQG